MIFLQPRGKFLLNFYYTYLYAMSCQKIYLLTEAGKTFLAYYESHAEATSIDI
ncbi:hypothetical protein NIES2135_43140 [Leptolyngbya boryana NIES-2135]|uniref:Uncharacterized protein n=1 Tax=Leptolyngbya boryana NIES-2135 TaxID=1973484 RepID=A0A1Z4JL16_LEPBY|nr:hypothetical protein NIES2135_43140 [Leptolyngbya boryana NIES-2135]